MKKILFAGAEVMPFAASGGLGDVLGSLPAALNATGEMDVRVAMPLYSTIPEKFRAEMKTECIFEVELAWRHLYCGIKSLCKDGVTYYFIDNEYYFKRPALYGSFDDGERFAFFAMAVVEMMRHIDFYPDILHAHDWSSALTLVYLNRKYRTVPGYENIRTVFTIHNIEYQGNYGFDILWDVFGLNNEDGALMAYDGRINLMKGAIQCADMVTTVSPRYAEEILTPQYASGLQHILQQNTDKLCGILNGIDYVYNDPENDPAITKGFNAGRQAGKAANKLALQKELGLPETKEVPMLAIISRLVSHKGLDLVAEIAERALQDGVQLVVLGTGEARFEDFFRSLEAKYPDRMRALITYDRNLSKRIYAACDIFLMPSKSEPCGLSQMIASRYGAIPVTRETGGLYDSIKGYWEEGKTIHGNGFTFAGYSAWELLDAIHRAEAVWYDAARRRKLIAKIMETDFSWAASGAKYIEMYEAVLSK